MLAFNSIIRNKFYYVENVNYNGLLSYILHNSRYTEYYLFNKEEFHPINLSIRLKKYLDAFECGSNIPEIVFAVRNSEVI